MEEGEREREKPPWKKETEGWEREEGTDEKLKGARDIAHLIDLDDRVNFVQKGKSDKETNGTS